MLPTKVVQRGMREQVRAVPSKMNKSTQLGAFVHLVETTGLEPVTPCMSSKYSNQLSYASEYLHEETVVETIGLEPMTPCM